MERNDGFQDLAGSIAEGRPYARKEGSGRKLMSVAEMGRILGLGKTDRYWLLHKGFFETRVINRKTWVDIASFEKWYAGQVKYRKVDGEEPGRDLKEQSYSVRDAAGMLGLSEATVYELIKRDGIPTVKVDYWMRIPKEAFEKWYAGQSRYRTTVDREKDLEAELATITMPEMARLLGIPREEVYGILKNVQYKSFFEYVTVAGRRRITKESFRRFLKGQDKFKPDPKNEYEEIVREENARLADFRRKKISGQGGIRRGNGNLEYLTVQEAALLAGVSKGYIDKRISLGNFPIRRAGHLVRIPRKEFSCWLARWRADHGINS